MALLIVYYLLSILGIFKKNSKVLTVLMIAIMWIVFGLCTYNGDFGNYEWIYKNIQDPNYWSEFELLFNIMMYVCNIIGLSFIQFRMVFGAIFIIVLYITIRKYTENTSEVLGMFMIFPFLYFTSVIRSGLASVLVALAFYEITAGRNKKKLFWILIFIAVFIHYTSIAFVIYYYLRNKKYQNKSFIIVFTIVLAVLILYYTGFIYNIMSLIITNQRTLKWFAPSMQKVNFIVYLVIISIVVLFISYFSKKQNDKLRNKDLAYNEFSSDIFFINVSMQIFIPTYFISNACARFIWQIMVINIIGYAKDDEILSINSKRNNLVNIKTLILGTFLVLLFIYTNLPYANTVNDGLLIFENNLLFKM